MAISLANPRAIGYWATLGGATAAVAAGIVWVEASDTVAFLAGYFAGALAWSLVVAAGVRWLPAQLADGSRMWRAPHRVCGILLIMLRMPIGWQAWAAR